MCILLYQDSTALQALYVRQRDQTYHFKLECILKYCIMTAIWYYMTHPVLNISCSHYLRLGHASAWFDHQISIWYNIPTSYVLLAVSVFLDYPLEERSTATGYNTLGLFGINLLQSSLSSCGTSLWYNCYNELFLRIMKENRPIRANCYGR